MALKEILIVNPAPRKNQKRGNTMAARKRRKPRTAAQKAATRKMIAANKRARRAPARRRSPVRRTTAARRNPVRRSPVRRARRNPVKVGMVEKMVKPAVFETAGAVALDVAMGYINPRLPLQMSTGVGNNLVKIGVSFGLGIIAEKFAKKKTAHDMARGALVVTTHNMVRNLIQTQAPQIPLGAYHEDTMGSYYNTGVGSYFDAQPSPYSIDQSPARQFAMADGYPSPVSVN